MAKKIVTVEITAFIHVDDAEIQGMRNWSDYDDDDARASAIARESAFSIFTRTPDWNHSDTYVIGVDNA